MARHSKSPGPRGKERIKPLKREAPEGGTPEGGALGNQSAPIRQVSAMEVASGMFNDELQKIAMRLGLPFGTVVYAAQSAMVSAIAGMSPNLLTAKDNLHKATNTFNQLVTDAIQLIDSGKVSDPTAGNTGKGG